MNCLSADDSHDIRTLDKLLGQLGIYITWLSLIAYLQKQLRIFIFFYASFFFCDYTFSYCLKPSGMCLHIYTLPSSAFLKYHVHFAKFHFHYSVFPRNTGLGIDILFINWSYIARSLVKKINSRLAFVYYPNGNEIVQMVCNDIACNCIPIIRIAFRYACISF